MIARALQRQVLTRIPISLAYCEPLALPAAIQEIVEPNAALPAKSAPSEPTAQTTLGMYA